MLNPGLTQERVGDVSLNQISSNHNPLPQWARVNTLDKARYPKPFLKDKLQPLESKPAMDGEDRDLDISGMNPAQRIQYLERSLHFLRQQHSDVLRALHGEVEQLKRENKDLQHKAVMIQRSQHHHDNQTSTVAPGDSSGASSKSKHGGSSSKEDKAEEMKVMFLEEEIKELKHALRESRNKNTYLHQRLEQSEEACKRQRAALETLKQQSSQGGGAGGERGGGLGVGTSQAAGHSQVPGAAAQQPQSLAEYQTIIKQLQQINERQAHELDSLKSDLRDVLYSHKWTPDAYLLARAYVTDDDRKGRQSSTAGSKSALPKISLKERGQPLSEVGVVQDCASLPALPQSVGNKAMERRKRVQLMQKDKLRRQVVPE